MPLDTRLKQRLVGALILTALAIIVLPMLLDGSAEDRRRIVNDIPQAPRSEMKRLSVEDLRQRMERMERASAARLPREVVDEAEYDDQADFSLDTNNLPISWSLQLGSFRNSDNAVRLRAALREAGHHSYILHARTGEGETWRVFVGPMLKKTELLTLAGSIEKRFGLKGQIVRYRIEDDAGQIGG